MNEQEINLLDFMITDERDPYKYAVLTKAKKCGLMINALNESVAEINEMISRATGIVDENTHANDMIIGLKMTLMEIQNRQEEIT